MNIGKGIKRRTALYTFANIQAKTEEYDFRGFPALWNVVVFYMINFDSDPRLNLAVILFLGAMTFAPVRFIHPVRVVALRRLTSGGAVQPHVPDG